MKRVLIDPVIFFLLFLFVFYITGKVKYSGCSFFGSFLSGKFVGNELQQKAMEMAGMLHFLICFL